MLAAVSCRPYSLYTASVVGREEVECCQLLASQAKPIFTNIVLAAYAAAARKILGLAMYKRPA